MHLRACSMKRFSDKAAKCDVPADSEDDVTNLLSNPDIVKKLTSQYSNVLLHEVMHLKDVIYHVFLRENANKFSVCLVLPFEKLDDMQQQLENILDDVVATCRYIVDYFHVQLKHSSLIVTY